MPPAAAAAMIASIALIKRRRGSAGVHATDMGDTAMGEDESKEDETTDDSGFQPADETPEPDWGTTEPSPSGGADTKDDDSDFRPPSDIREPDWTS
jgi:hypothetical protein